jgi:hypothetical protein
MGQASIRNPGAIEVEFPHLAHLRQVRQSGVGDVRVIEAQMLR